ncbi:MAG TPA: hypothetical protein DCP28_19940 [Cytophagales bacterium]|nr:hypothetical protein [Cytophagales bacterium]
MATEEIWSAVNGRRTNAEDQKVLCPRDIFAGGANKAKSLLGPRLRSQLARHGGRRHPMLSQKHLG